MKKIQKISLNGKTAEQIKYAKIVSGVLVCAVILFIVAFILAAYLAYKVYAVQN